MKLLLRSLDVAHVEQQKREPQVTFDAERSVVDLLGDADCAPQVVGCTPSIAFVVGPHSCQAKSGADVEGPITALPREFFCLDQALPCAGRLALAMIDVPERRQCE